MTLAVALCAAMALSISVTTPLASAAPTLTALAYNDHNQQGWMCPVATQATGRFKRSYDEDGGYTLTFKVTTATTTGYNGYVFAACRAYVYVDIVSKNGDSVERRVERHGGEEGEAAALALAARPPTGCPGPA